MREPSESRRRVGQEKKDGDTPGGTYRAHDDEFVTPRRESTFDLADTVSNQTADGYPDTIEGIPCADPRGLFGPGVEHAGEQPGVNGIQSDQSVDILWRKTHMNAGSAIASNAPDKTRKAARVAKFFDAAWHINNAPHMKMLNPRYHAGGDRCMIRLEGMAQASWRKYACLIQRPTHPSEVEDRAEPAISITRKVEIIFDPKNGSVR